MSAYYNEMEPYAAQWLRNLIAAGHIAPGVVDERSIDDVHPNDLRGFTQCHFFAGIGVWSLALRRAGWPDDRPVWTGSCPCQPFSSAGAGAGFADERHLWPAFHHLIAQHRPPAILGEQVASKDADPWINLVQNDMEALGYAFGAVAFPSASVGAPHIRDRNFWVAYTGRQRREPFGFNLGSAPSCDEAEARQWQRVRPHVGSGNELGGLANTSSGKPTKLTGHGHGPGTKDRTRSSGWPARRGAIPAARRAGPTNGYWSDADWLRCRDGKWRPVEPGSFPLAHGAPARVGSRGADWHTPAGPQGIGHRTGRLKGYGNAINAEAGRVFVEAAMECIDER